MEPSNEKKDILVYTNEPRTLSVTPDWRIFLGNIEEILAEENLVLTGAVGRWDGVRSGWEPVKSVHDIESFLEDCGTVEVTEDPEGRLHILGIHHDGRNRAELSIVAYGYDPEDEPSGQIDPSRLLPLGYTGRFGSDPAEPGSDWDSPSGYLVEYARSGDMRKMAASDGTTGSDWHGVQSTFGTSFEALKALRKWYERNQDDGDFQIDGYLEDWGNPGSFLVGVSSLWSVDDRWDDVLEFLRDMFTVLRQYPVESRLCFIRSDGDGFTAAIHINEKTP